jgi:hypothetical protein
MHADGVAALLIKIKNKIQYVAIVPDFVASDPTLSEKHNLAIENW